jgi:hypothetical protein
MSYTVGERLQKQLKAKKLLDDAIAKLNIAYKPLSELLALCDQVDDDDDSECNTEGSEEILAYGMHEGVYQMEWDVMVGTPKLTDYSEQLGKTLERYNDEV